MHTCTSTFAASRGLQYPLRSLLISVEVVHIHNLPEKSIENLSRGMQTSAPYTNEFLYTHASFNITHRSIQKNNLHGLNSINKLIPYIHTLTENHIHMH